MITLSLDLEYHCSGVFRFHAKVMGPQHFFVFKLQQVIEMVSWFDIEIYMQFTKC
jgi:hypothetical protein